MVNAYGKNTTTFAIAPSFFTITDPSVGLISLEVTPIASNMILDESHNTLQAKKMFNMQIRAIMWQKYPKIN